MQTSKQFRCISQVLDSKKDRASVNHHKNVINFLIASKFCRVHESRGVQYVHWVMHKSHHDRMHLKCIMIKVGGETKYTKYVKSR